MFPKDPPQITAFQRKQLKEFKKILLQYGERLNLFSRCGNELEQLFKEGLLTGQMLSPFFPSTPVLDLGSGNGFPGLVCSILYPKTPLILCERNRKRAEFLKHALFHIKCQNAQVLCQPAEELRVSFSLILSKATGPLDQILKILEKILGENGSAIFWKSPQWKRDWPKSSPFSAKAFKSYSVEGKKGVLLQVKKHSF